MKKLNRKKWLLIILSLLIISSGVLVYLINKPIHSYDDCVNHIFRVLKDYGCYDRRTGQYYTEYGGFIPL